jgi:hypothetical protein
MIEDPNHPEYDPRVELPLDRELMASIRLVGQLEPASGYQVKGLEGKSIIHLLFGRQRWRAVREIWDEMREAGDDMTFAPVFRICLQKDEGPAAKRQKRIIENRHRQGLDGLALAREVAAHLAIVGNDDQAMEATRVLFNFKSLAALQNCLSQLETTPKVQAAISAGTISPTAALHLSRQPDEIQDAVVDLIEEERTTDKPDPEPQIDAFEPEAKPETTEARATKPVSVSKVDEMINKTKGQTTYEMVTLKLVEKRLEKIESDLDKALTKLEDCTDHAKQTELSARVARLQGWDEALRWARGETTVVGKGTETQGNDKMSAAWQVLFEALTSAAWPRVLESRNAAGFPEWVPSMRAEDPEHEARYQRECNEARKRMDMSARLVIAGEVVADRSVGCLGVTTDIRVNVGSKWFIRLMDPHGSPSKMIREWGAHAWLVGQGKAATVPNYKGRISQYGYDMTLIKIHPNQVERMVAGTTLGTPKSVEDAVLDIVRDEVGPEKAGEVTRESRFGSPWLTVNDEDPEAIGPDMAEGDHVRDCIIDQIWDQIQVSVSEPAFANVGELIDYVAGMVAKHEAEHGA